MGHHVSVICGLFGQPKCLFYDDGIIVYPIISPSKLAYYVGKIPLFRFFSNALNYLIMGFVIHIYLIKINSKNKIDFVEYTEGGDFWNSITKKFSYASHLHGSRYTFKNKSGQQVTKTEWLERKLQHYFILNSGIVFSPCNAMLKIVEKEMDRTLNSFVIPYPLNTRFGTSKPNGINIKKTKINILFASRKDPVKGGTLLLDALCQLNEKTQSMINVEFFGYRPLFDVSNLNFLTLHDFIHIDALKSAYDRTDICVIPSIFDNSPNTVYEAMASGNLVIASKIGGIPEIIGGSENGYLFDPNDQNDLTRKLTEAVNLILSGNDITIRKNARKRINTIADPYDNVQKRLSLISQL